MTPEQTALIITAASPMILAILGGFGWLIKWSVTRSPKAEDRPEVTQGIPVIPPKSAGIDPDVMHAVLEHHQAVLVAARQETAAHAIEVRRLRELLIRNDIDPDT